MTRRTLRRVLVLGLLLAGLPALAAAQTPGPQRAYMDTTCSPCKDFFEYANGTWLATTRIPPAYPSIGMGREIFDRNQVTLTRVLERAAAGTATEKDPTLRKLGWLYAGLMDSTRTDREALAPVQADIERIERIAAQEDLRREFANPDGYAPFQFASEVDPGQSTMNIGQLTQGGLGLPERDYYFRTDPKSDTLRQVYVGHIERVLMLTGMASGAAREAAARIMKLETALAESSLSVTEMRDPEKLYHKMPVKQLRQLCPSLDWPAFFTEVGVSGLASANADVDASMPAFLRQLGRLIDTTPLQDWRVYLRYHTVRGGLPWLGQAAFDEAFAFNSKLTGQQAPTPRWKRAANAMDGAMGEALGKAYVATEFPPSSKARMNELVDNLRIALKRRIETRPWMSPATKEQALKKLAAFIQKIGYPDTWRDYSALTIDPEDPAYTNLRRAQLFEYRRDLAKIGKPVDRSEWLMTAATVNAYYNPPTNEICFPAGILQPPMFDPQADDAANYGAIGAVIGHEMTHGFDDEGRKYDADGNLRDWWTAEDTKEFEARTQKLVDEYNGFIAVDTIHVNGRFTLGENLADLGGVSLAYEAWKISLEGKPAPATVDGFTPDQRFFLSFAQIWRNLYRPELARLQALTDVHSLPHWRVVGPLMNLPEFARAFDCQPGDPMVIAADKRTDVW
jgi:predicted metalloendopeptidase